MTVCAWMPFQVNGHAGQETKSVVLGAGCFWCVEAIFEQQPGVVDVVSGYAGGKTEKPTYKQVTRGNTGHAEVVKITYDPSKTDLAALLSVFWKSHDPTDPRGVWPDFGSNYRSIILYSAEEERGIIEKSKREIAAQKSKPIATEIAPLQEFYPAEEYHQDYVKRNPDDPYVQRVSIPRLKESGLKAP